MDSFEKFVDAHRSDLGRIARHTRGEHQFHDVVGEAWLMAHTLAEKHGVPLDLDDEASCKRLLAHLYQHLVRYTERHVRYAVRLDPGGYDTADAAHPLLQRIAADPGSDPLAALCRIESSPAATTGSSQAAAYVLLLRQCNGSMHSLARYLLISPSYAYRRCARIRTSVSSQHSLDLCLAVSTQTLRPWRERRHERVPRQLEFDFAERLAFAVPTLQAGHRS